MPHLQKPLTPYHQLLKNSTLESPVPPACGEVRGGAMSQAFHQRVDHDKSGYYRASDRRLLLAAMFGWATAIVPEMSVDVN
jgi:hypothetical protein